MISPYRHIMIAPGRGGISVIPEYRAVYDAMVEKPSLSDIIIQNRFMKALVDGGVLDDLDVLYLFNNHLSFGGADCLINYKNPGTYNATIPINLNFKKYAGYSGNGTGYMRSHFTPSGNEKMQKDNVCMGFYDMCRGLINDDGSSKYASGAFNSSAPGKRLALTPNSSAQYCWANENVSAIQSSSDYPGFMIVQRQNANQKMLIKNGTITIQDALSVELIDIELYPFGVNLNGSISTSTLPYDTKSLWFCGKYLSEDKINILRNAYYQYLKDISNNLFNSVIVFGDSIPGGYGTTNAITKRFGRLISSNENVFENIQSTGGATIQNELLALKYKFNWWDRNSKIIIFAGTNDLNNFGLSSKENFILKYTELINSIINFGYKRNQIYICNTFWRSDINDVNIELWNESYQVIANENNVNLIDVYTGSKGQTSWFSVDVVHPNDVGHEFIANQIIDSF